MASRGSPPPPKRRYLIPLSICLTSFVFLLSFELGSLIDVRTHLGILGAISTRFEIIFSTIGIAFAIELKQAMSKDIWCYIFLRLSETQITKSIGRVIQLPHTFLLQKGLKTVLVQGWQWFWTPSPSIIDREKYLRSRVNCKTNWSLLFRETSWGTICKLHYHGAYMFMRLPFPSFKLESAISHVGLKTSIPNMHVPKVKAILLWRMWKHLYKVICSTKKKKGQWANKLFHEIFVW